jgi:c-di-GMP-binding flagellar brake protein YcgR
MKRLPLMDKSPLPLPADARAAHRLREKLFVSYTIAADVAAEYTQTYDIASGGLAMLTNAPLARDVDIVIELELCDDARPRLRLNANVRWSTYDPLLQKYRTGVSFVGRTPEVERQLRRYIDTLHRIRDLRTP